MSPMFMSAGSGPVFVVEVKASVRAKLADIADATPACRLRGLVCWQRMAPRVGLKNVKQELSQPRLASPCSLQRAHEFFAFSHRSV